jgi:hypothetical protein
MPSYPTPGVGGQVKKGSAVIGNITQWSGGPQAELANTTAFGASGSCETQVTCILKWSFKFDGSTDVSDTSQAAMHNGIGATDTYNFWIDGTHYWSGTAILNKIMDKANAQKGVVTSEYDLTGTAPLVWN